MAAIRETLKKEGVTLIQGPPGTGKTTTVLGTLSVLLNSSNKSEEKLIGGKNLNEKFISNNEISHEKTFKNFEKSMPWIYKKNYENWLIF